MAFSDSLLIRFLSFYVLYVPMWFKSRYICIVTPSFGKLSALISFQTRWVEVETLQPPDFCNGRMNCKGAETVRHTGWTVNAAFLLND